MRSTPIGRASIWHPGNVGSWMRTMMSIGSLSSCSVCGMKP
jgi:hypothetical protein